VDDAPMRWRPGPVKTEESAFVHSVRRSPKHRGMWHVAVYCSGCSEESEVVVNELDEVEREACACGYSFVVLSVSSFEPVYARGGELIELVPRDDLPLVA
jgi:hypothetical protein